MFTWLPLIMALMVINFVMFFPTSCLGWDLGFTVSCHKNYTTYFSIQTSFLLSVAIVMVKTGDRARGTGRGKCCCAVSLS